MRTTASRKVKYFIMQTHVDAISSDAQAFSSSCHVIF